jgi:MFS transporter, OFA family, oxalate/formate antiporter
VYTIAIVCFAATFIVTGRLQDAKGPRVWAFLGALLVGGGFTLSSMTRSVTFLYLAFGAIFGIGNGFGYAAPTPVASKCRAVQVRPDTAVDRDAARRQ